MAQPQEAHHQPVTDEKEPVGNMSCSSGGKLKGQSLGPSLSYAPDHGCEHAIFMAAIWASMEHLEVGGQTHLSTSQFKRESRGFRRKSGATDQDPAPEEG